MKTKVYSAFPGVGKTTYFNTTEKNVLDSDSSKFDKKNFPANYIEHIDEEGNPIPIGEKGRKRILQLTEQNPK